MHSVGLEAFDVISTSTAKSIALLKDVNFLGTFCIYGSLKLLSLLIFVCNLEWLGKLSNYLKVDDCQQVT